MVLLEHQLPFSFWRTGSATRWKICDVSVEVNLDVIEGCELLVHIAIWIVVLFHKSTKCHENFQDSPIIGNVVRVKQLLCSSQARCEDHAYCATAIVNTLQNLDRNYPTTVPG